MLKRVPFRATVTAALALALVAALALAPTAPLRAADDKAPDTVKILKLVPENAQLALALPAPNAIIATLVELNKRIPGVDLAKELDDIVYDLKYEANVPEAKTLGDIAKGKGLSADAPIGIIVDGTPSLNDLKGRVEKAVAEQKAEKEKMEKEKAEKEAAAKADAAKPADGEKKAEAKEGEKKDGEKKGEGKGEGRRRGGRDRGPRLKIDTKNLKMPEFAVVVGVSDEAKAKELLEELAMLSPEIASADKKTEETAGLAIAMRGDYGHFFTKDNQLVIGTVAMLKRVAERTGKPAEVRYGGSACPATGKVEAVSVVYGERALPLIKEFLPIVPLEDAGKAALLGQFASFEKSLAGAKGQDPAVVTLSIDAKKGLALTARMDTANYPGILESSGQAKPLPLGTLLPKDTLALIDLGLTPEQKKQFTDVAIPAASQGLGDAAAQAVPIAKQALDMLGDEITLGISAVKDDFPAASLLVSLADPEPTKGLLQMLVPMMPDEKLKEYGINSIAAPIPVPLSIAFADKFVLVSNNTDTMKSILDLQKANKTTDYLKSLNPPIDPAKPRYSTILIDSKLLTDILVPLSALGGGVPADAKPIVDIVSQAVRELRITNELSGSWSVSAITISLKDAPAAEPAKAASPA